MNACRFASILTCLVVVAYISSCSNGSKNNGALLFDPEVDQLYHLSIIRSSTRSYSDKSSKAYPPSKISDTLFMDGQLSRGSASDTEVVIKLRILNLEIKRPQQALQDPAKNPGIIDYIQIRNRIFDLIDSTSILLTFNRRGEVTHVKRIELLTQRLRSKVKQDTVLAEWVSVINDSDRSILHDFVSEAAIKDIFNTIFFLLPAREVQPGERWGNEFILNTKAPVKYSSLFTLQGKEKDSSLIEIESIISATTGEGGKTYMKGKRHGTSKLNMTTGVPAEFHSINQLITSTDSSEIATTEKLTVTITSKH